jgi:hypothetical protein
MLREHAVSVSDGVLTHKIQRASSGEIAKPTTTLIVVLTCMQLTELGIQVCDDIHSDDPNNLSADCATTASVIEIRTMRKLHTTPLTNDVWLTFRKTLESDHYICIRQQIDDNASPEVIIIDLKDANNVIRRPIKADSALMHWNKQIIALNAQKRTLQIFDLAQKAKLKSATMSEDVLFWKWYSESTLGIVTDNSVYHWNIFDANQATPVKVFDRSANLQVPVGENHQKARHEANITVGPTSHQLPCQRRRTVDGRSRYLPAARPHRWSHATILKSPRNKSGHRRTCCSIWHHTAGGCTCRYKTFHIRSSHCHWSKAARS